MIRKNTKAFDVAILCIAAVGISLVFLYPQVNDFKCSNFTPGLQDPRPTQDMGHDEKIHDVIVIGAGIGGLEAAHELDSEGMNVVVLEARDRIGGRLDTYHYSDTALDLGGSWIHGLANYTDGPENPIYKLATTNNIKVIKTDGTEKIYDSWGNEVTIDSKYYEKYDTIIEEKKGTDPDEWKTLSVEDVMNEAGAFDGLNETERAIFRHVMIGNIDLETAASSNETAFEDTVQTGYFADDTEQEAIFPEGYNQIVNCLAGRLDIRHATVTKVNYTESPIVLSTDKGDFKTKYVVSTIPLGVLRTDAVKFFPDLDKDKKEAIDNLRMGTMDKVYLIFNDKVPFWDTDKDWISHISYDMREDGTYDTTWKYFFNMYKYDGQPILLAFNTDDAAIKLENESDATIKREVTEVLRKMYRNETIQEPEIVRTKWATESLSWGSYSFVPKGGSLSDIDELAKPIGNRLFFAGEATSLYYYGSVHGAYITGYRAAQEILNLENKVDSPSEQLEHGIRVGDVICPDGFTLRSFEESPEPECVLK